MGRIGYRETVFHVKEEIMRQRWIFVVIALTAAFLLQGLTTAWGQTGTPSGGNGIVEEIGTAGTINWTKGIVEAVGSGATPQRFLGKPQARPMALTAAQLEAYRKLLEVTGGVRVDATTLVQDYAAESDVVKTEVEDLVKGAQIASIDYLSDGTVEVTLRMALGDGLAQVIFNREQNKSAGVSHGGAVQEGSVPAASPPCTGLVVDARGLGVRPAMVPKILNEKGEEIYGWMQVDREYALQQGMSGYARDLEAAKRNPRVFDVPITLKALNAEGAGRTNVVISNDDADKIREEAKNSHFLAQCRVMIVLDQ